MGYLGLGTQAGAATGNPATQALGSWAWVPRLGYPGWGGDGEILLQALGSWLWVPRWLPSPVALRPLLHLGLREGPRRDVAKKVN